MVTHEERALLALAKQLRDATADAGRPDVVAKVDEAILLLAGADADDDPDKPISKDEKTNIVLRILDGLGF
ncbi:hypothetical protein OHA21_10540 [Actinoplanes sp. NBC_00393]|uniref:hypothetical protein n=1 Tax=Actinoplanes sp. NBC_00393 TaxID=2975953 RepID=UPI002E1D9881